MEYFKKIAMFLITLVLVFITLSTGEVEISKSVGDSITTSVREYVIRNNLFKAGLLLEEFKKNRIVGIYLEKNSNVVIGEYIKGSIFIRKNTHIIYADNEKKAELARLIVAIDTMPAFVSSVFLSVLLFLAFSFYLEGQNRKNEKILQAEMESKKIYELKKQAQEFVHDIKSPLVSLELALSQIDKASINHSEIGVMNRSVIRIKEIGNRFIENQEINQDWVELIIVAKEMRDLVQDKIAELSIDIKLEIDKSAENCKVLASRDLFKRMMSNLINNSYEATRNTQEKAQIQVSVKVVDHQVVFILEDNGMGFPDKMLTNKEFNPLTTKNTGKGIGLSTANSNLVRWGGQLNIGNKNKGAIVRMFLKNYEDYQIVLIDDDELNRMIWEREARKINMNFLSYEDYSDEVANKINTKNTLIYLDSNLSHDKKGEDLIEQIKLSAMVDVCFFIETGNEKSKYKNIANISGVSSKKPNWIV